MLKKLNSIIKDFILFSKIALIITPFRHSFQFLSNLVKLTKWIGTHGKGKCSYRFIRNYDDREKLYAKVINEFNLEKEQLVYLEFGVFSGTSFKWWLNANKNTASRFYGFDTFEGLPEDWHFFKKGDMLAAIPSVNDERALFVKGLFQHTLFNFIKEQDLASPVRKIIHLDADLFSSTLFVLTSLAPYLHKGDILFFDEFSVPNHEFAAWDIFTSSYYANFKVLGAVNNFYQLAVMFEGYK